MPSVALSDIKEDGWLCGYIKNVHNDPKNTDSGSNNSCVFNWDMLLHKP